MPIERGVAWGRPTTATPDLVVTGGDRDLATHAGRDGLIRFVPRPDSDLARTLGLRVDSESAGSGAGTEVALDVMHIAIDGTDYGRAVNAVAVGLTPDAMHWWSRSRSLEVAVDGRELFAGRATGFVVASGQYLRGADVNPRSHPGDGKVELQVYALPAGARAAMRRRLATGTHVPHPSIRQGSGGEIVIVAGVALPVLCDDIAVGAGRRVVVRVEPASVRLLL